MATRNSHLERMRADLACTSAPEMDDTFLPMHCQPHPLDYSSEWVSPWKPGTKLSNTTNLPVDNFFCSMNVADCRPAYGAHHSSLLIGLVMTESRKGRRDDFRPERLCTWAPFANKDGSVKRHYRPMGSPFLILDQHGKIRVGLLEGTIILGGDVVYQQCLDFFAGQDLNAICPWVIDKLTTSEDLITPFMSFNVPQHVIRYAATPAREFLTMQNTNLNGLVYSLRAFAAPELLFHYFRRLREEQGVFKLPDSKDAGVSCELQASAIRANEIPLAHVMRSFAESSWEEAMAARGEENMDRGEEKIEFMSDFTTFNQECYMKQPAKIDMHLAESVIRSLEPDQVGALLEADVMRSQIAKQQWLLDYVRNGASVPVRPVEPVSLEVATTVLLYTSLDTYKLLLKAGVFCKPYLAVPTTRIANVMEARASRDRQPGPSPHAVDWTKLRQTTFTIKIDP